MIITVDGLEVDATAAMHFGHRFPDGTVTAHDQLLSAQAGVSLFGGEVVIHMSYAGPWMALAPEHQPTWLVSTE